jgi:phosphotransferase system enzyme I (PtsP)
LKKIADAGARAGIPVTLCGELGGRPIEAMTLIGLGYRSLSMSPASIGPVKAMLIELEAVGIANHIGALLEKSNGAPSLRPKIESFAQANGIPV